MLNQNNYIEQILLSHGKTISLKENQRIALKGEECKYLIYLPQNTRLLVNQKEVLIDKGVYLNIQEYFRQESVRNTIEAIEKTKVVFIDRDIIEKNEDKVHQLQLFFLRILATQAPKMQLVFE